MSKRRQGQTNFALGELSPRLAGRSDIALYRNGAARLLNRHPLAQGGTSTRPGTRWITSTLPTPAAIPAHARLHPFVFNPSQRYVCLLVEGAMWAFDAVSGAFANGVVGAPWTGSMVPDMGWVQAGNTSILLHPIMFPKRILRTGAASWVLTDMPVEVPPFSRLLDAAITMTISASGAAGTGGAIGFSSGVMTANWLGKQVLYRGKRMQITAIFTPADAAFTWLEDATGLSTEHTTDWRHEAWLPEFGYPSTGEFIDGRLVLAASTAEPNAVWASRAGAYFSWETGANDGDAIVEPVGGAQVSLVRHLVAQERLQVLTDRAVWQLRGADNGPITPTTVAYRRLNQIGASEAQPVVYDGATIFADTPGRNLYEVLYDGATERTDVSPVSLIAEHLIKQPVRLEHAPARAAQPEPLVLMPNADGTMTVFHSVRSERISAFFEWVTDGAWLDVCSVGEDVFALVSRGSSGIALEELVWDAAPLDCARRLTSAGKTRVWGGMGHLAGRTVSVVSRGHDLGDYVVDGNGVVTMGPDRPEVDEVEIGLRFLQIIRPMPIDFDLEEGPVRGLKKRLIRCFVQVVNSGPFRVQGRRVLLDFVGDDFDSPPPGGSGIIEVRLRGVDEEAVFDIEVDRPHRVTLLSLTREVSVGG
ncbi:hypothetical protein GXW74_19785 [Roseomonas eburnea]|uniref:Uncharacterized protein n=1 Tax=Neoroseomonas eburnea TaxID=1346889 RepID=A0A9X9XGA7_9PROT|nr:hypothetical protein [Neoroseomonas eburnea]MBR0682743.1 hypothetical protein [Neoroseomonas eburnea]